MTVAQQPVKDLAEDLRAKRSRIVESMWKRYKDDPRQLESVRDMTEEDIRMTGASSLSPAESDEMVEIWRELHARAVAMEGGKK